jgi:predicted O-methyltransferase YrrM
MKKHKHADAPGQGAGAPPPTDAAADATGTGDAPENLDFVFADLKQQLKEQLVRLGQVGRETALAVAARIDADAAIAETALGSLELEEAKKKRRRAQVRRLEKLVERVSAVDLQASRGRRRDLRRIARSVRRIVTTLTEPVE